MSRDAAVAGGRLVAVERGDSVLAAGAEGDRGAVVGERADGGGADAEAAAGNDRAAVGQVQVDHRWIILPWGGWGAECSEGLSGCALPKQSGALGGRGGLKASVQCRER